ncbi:hypothetical protein Patl1_33450 [Pistacia atlantica]|uniref:Uncharacterized protein n=1 Tax=Pistacia atlantica TaxID=434234 RepID=A0ACC0ZQ39_9ROSI|nr:hypothetical protein Patl1_33450 [Pistacia atlantica]
MAMLFEELLSEFPWLVARLPKEIVATQSADKYATQTTILIQIVGVDFRLEPKMMRIICKRRLSTTSNRISHPFQNFLTPSANSCTAPIFSSMIKLQSTINLRGKKPFVVAN